MPEKHVNVIAGPTANPMAPRPRLTPRVYAERASTAFRVLAYRLKKAILSDNLDMVKSAASAMTSEERYAALEQFGDDIVKGYWNPTSRKFDAPRPMENYNQTLPADASRAVPTTGAPTIAPQRETGFLRAVERGAIVNFMIDGERHHGKILRWGKTGATVVAQNGEVAHVLWTDLTMGVHAEAAIDHAQRVAKSEEARAHRTTMRKSAGLPDDALYAMSPTERAAYLERG